MTCQISTKTHLSPDTERRYCECTLDSPVSEAVAHLIWSCEQSCCVWKLLKASAQRGAATLLLKQATLINLIEGGTDVMGNTFLRSTLTNLSLNLGYVPIIYPASWSVHSFITSQKCTNTGLVLAPVRWGFHLPVISFQIHEGKWTSAPFKKKEISLVHTLTGIERCPEWPKTTKPWENTFLLPVIYI